MHNSHSKVVFMELTIQREGEVVQKVIAAEDDSMEVT